MGPPQSLGPLMASVQAPSTSCKQLITYLHSTAALQGRPAQRGLATCPRSHSRTWRSQDLNPAAWLQSPEDPALPEVCALLAQLQPALTVPSLVGAPYGLPEMLWVGALSFTTLNAGPPRFPGAAPAWSVLPLQAGGPRLCLPWSRSDSGHFAAVLGAGRAPSHWDPSVQNIRLPSDVLIWVTSMRREPATQPPWAEPPRTHGPGLTPQLQSRDGAPTASDCSSPSRPLPARGSRWRSHGPWQPSLSWGARLGPPPPLCLAGSSRTLP